MSVAAQAQALPSVRVMTRKPRVCANCGHADQGSLGKPSAKDTKGQPYGCSHYDELDNICGCHDWAPSR